LLGIYIFFTYTAITFDIKDWMWWWTICTIWRIYRSKGENTIYDRIYFSFCFTR